MLFRGAQVCSGERVRCDSLGSGVLRWSCQVFFLGIRCAQEIDSGVLRFRCAQVSEPGVIPWDEVWSGDRVRCDSLGSGVLR